MYQVIRIPLHSSRLSELILKFKAAKLAALVAEPTSFATRHAEEALLPILAWEQRLAAPSATFICVAVSKDNVESGDEAFLLLNEWVGMVTIRGPLPYSDFYLPATGQPQPAESRLEAYWHMATLYVSSAHRNRGLAKRLVNAAIEYARRQVILNENSERIMRARIRLFCDPRKQHVVRMYSNLGFSEAGRNTLKEAFEANGDESQIPADTNSTETLRNRWELRFGLAMEKMEDMW
ncbi:hypothetical protein B0J11DRAFT_508289 [Dendryphion nanum]|uniref:N-acetyltransferase domain-containing protein n=1 Tax=Dendryphion nanum TaxID=256645 RepID=A0A9P9IHY2_9PLEO|nr:hypothetical protein B0J11DRAFT_508289 [Dendryphion nanum]